MGRIGSFEQECKPEEIFSRSSKSHPAGLAEPCRKCGRTNLTTLECRVETNKCLRAVARASHCCLSPKMKGCRQRPPPLRPAAVGRAYMLSKREAATFGTVATRTLFSISKPFFVLVDSVASHSFTSTWYAIQLNLENKETKPITESSYLMTLEFSVLSPINLFQLLLMG